MTFIEVTGARRIAHICAEICGAKCCRHPGHVLVTVQEKVRLKALAKQRGIKVNFYTSPRYPGQFLMDLRRAKDSRTGPSSCPFLGANNLCTIYDKRPNGCSTFPVAPTFGCYLSPSDNPDGNRVEVIT
jgi:Fe-S-cluster containining protein